MLQKIFVDTPNTEDNKMLTTCSENKAQTVLGHSNTTECLSEIRTFQVCHKITGERVTIPRNTNFVNYIKENPHSYELLMGDVIPYFDVEQKFETQKEADDAFIPIYDSHYQHLQKYYNPENKDEIEIYVFDSTGINRERIHKVSFHFIIRGAGFYSCGDELKQLVEQWNKNEKLIFDLKVYKQRDRQQLFRMPYCSKEFDPQRKLIRMYEKNQDFLYHSLEDVKKIYNRFMVQNIDGEKPIKTDYNCNEEKKKIKKRRDNIAMPVNVSNNSDSNNSASNNNVPISEEEQFELDMKIYLENEKNSDSGTIKFQNGERKLSLEDVHTIINAIKKERIGDYDNWLHFILAIARWSDENEISEDDTLDMLNDFCQQCPNYNCKNDIVKKYREAFKKNNRNNKKITIGTVIHWAHQDNPATISNLFRKKQEIQPKEMIKFNTFDRNDPYCFVHFSTEFRDKAFPSVDDLIKEVRPKAQRVIARILIGKGVFVKKDNVTNRMFNMIDKLGECNFDMFHYCGKKKTKMTLLQFTRSHMPQFSEYVHEFENIQEHQFNTVVPFQAEIIPTPFADPVEKGLQKFLQFQNEVLANNDPYMIKYINSWVYTMLKLRHEITKAALVMIGREGIGKNTFTDFLTKHVLGEQHVTLIAGIAPLTEKHSTCMEGKRLVIVNEMAATKEEFLSNFERMKTFITEDTVHINPKNISPYNIRNVSNFVLISNNADSLHLSPTDRRYCVFDMNEKYMQNTTFFRELREESFNNAVGNAYYSYICNLSDVERIDILKIPKTKLKEEIINFSKPVWRKFLDAVIEDRDRDKDENKENEIKENEIKNDDNDDDEPVPKMFNSDRVRLSDFYQTFRNWCQDQGEYRIISMTKFGMAVKNNIQKVKVKGIYYYSISTIN